MEKAIVKIDTDPQPVSYLDKNGKLVTTSKKYKTEIQEFGECNKLYVSASVEYTIPFCW